MLVSNYCSFYKDQAMSKIPKRDCDHICYCVCHNPQLSLFETKGTPTDKPCYCDRCYHCDSNIILGQMPSHLKECHPQIKKKPDDCIHACRCACHDLEFALVSKHKKGSTCCDGKCKHCDSFIVRDQMERHLTECHRNLLDVNVIHLPCYLRKSSD